MSVQTIVLYGNRLHDKTAYSTNQDPQSFSLSLSEASTLADTGFQFLADSLALLDAAVRNDAIKALADSLGLTEQTLIASLKALSDELFVADSLAGFAYIKALSDFLRLKDWLELRLTRQNPWSSTATNAPRPSKIHNYGAGVYYGVDFYSSNPTVFWLLSAPNKATWESIPAVVPALPLYGAVLFGQKTFGSTPAVGWTKPVDTGKQAWQNANGESHN